MNWNNMQEMIVSKNLGKENEQVDGIHKTVNRQFDISNHNVSGSSEILDRQSETSHNKAPQRSTGRERKIPVARTNDFLW